jgi:hypothetical protein
MIRRTWLTKPQNLRRVPSKNFWQIDLGLWGDHCKSRRYWGRRWWLILQVGHRVFKHDIFLLKVLKGGKDLSEIDV